MVVEYIRYRIPEQQREAFERGYAEAAKPLAASRHSLGYELARCLKEPERYILRIEWDSVEGIFRDFAEAKDSGRSWGTFARSCR